MSVKKIFYFVLVFFVSSCTKDEMFLEIESKVKENTKDVGYKVDNIALSNSRQKDFGKSYWENVPYPADLYLSVFQKFTNPGIGKAIETETVSWGDFNLDGYMDIFNAGGSYEGVLNTRATFLIWNKDTKDFVETNLFNDSKYQSFGGNPHTVIPKYFNSDDYVDLLIIDSGDEGRVFQGPNEPIRIILSDGKGGYDVKEIETNENDNFFKIFNGRKWGADIGDINGDGVDDLFLACNSITYIYWGIPQYPYFEKKGRIFFASDYTNSVFDGEQGMSDCNECADHIFDGKIVDIDKDGDNDIVAFGADKNGLFHQRIMINKNGTFSNSDIIKLPINHPTDRRDIQDLIVDDFNGDGRLDIFYLLNHTTGDVYTTNTYIQKESLRFEIDESWSRFTTQWGPVRLIYFDVNNDGKKDITYHDSYTNIEENILQNRIYNKNVLIRSNNGFETENYYQYDSYAKTILETYYK